MNSSGAGGGGVTEAQKRNAERMLLSMASYAGESADQFSNWLAIGYSAILSVVVANLDKLRDFLDISDIKIIALLYPMILVIVLIQKRIFFSVQAAFKGNSIARDILSADPTSLSPEFTTNELLRSTLWIMKRYLKKRLERMKTETAAGDSLWNARAIAKRAQWQQWFVVLQFAITVYAAYLLADSIKL